jgi:predicted ester cyclase
MQKVGMICVMTLLCGGLLFAQHDKQKPPDKASDKGSVDKGSVEKNKATARRVFDDLWTGGRYELIDSMYEQNCVVHYATGNVSLQEAVAGGKEWRSAFPDLVVRAEQVTANGDIVTVHWVAHGTNSGQGKGLPGKGKQGRAQGTSKFRFDNSNKIAEVWVDWNEDALRRQVAQK